MAKKFLRNYYAGFIDNKIWIDGEGKPGIYKVRKDAVAGFEDVRQVSVAIEEVTCRKQKKKKRLTTR